MDKDGRDSGERGPHGSTRLRSRAASRHSPLGRSWRRAGDAPTASVWPMPVPAEIQLGRQPRRPSRPFHVMDLLAAASSGAARTATCSTSSPASRRRPRPLPVREAAKRALDEHVLGYTVALGIPELREAIAGAPRAGCTASTVDTRRRRGDDGVLGRLPARVPGGLRGRRPGGDRAARLPLLPQRAHRAGLRGGRAADRPGVPVPADRGDARGARRAGAGAGRREPGEPDRHDARARRAGGPRDLVRGARRAAGQRRDLPRHRVRHRRRARLGLGDLARGRGVQLVLEVLLDDRLADRLDARAASGCAARSTCSPATSRSARRCWPSTRRSRRSPPRRTPSATATSRGTPRTGGCCSRGCGGWASTGWRRPTARSTCTPTWVTSPTTRWGSATGCSRRPASPRPPGIDFDTEVGDRFVRLSFAGTPDEVTEALERLGVAPDGLARQRWVIRTSRPRAPRSERDGVVREPLAAEHDGALEQLDQQVVGVRHRRGRDAGHRRVHDRRRAALGEAAGAPPSRAR